MKILPDDHPSLSTVCTPVTQDELDGNVYDSQITEMVCLMLAGNGIGLAGPQVGIHKRLFVGMIDDNYGVYFNPAWRPLPMGHLVPMDELCLSLMVPRIIMRYDRVEFSWTNWSGVRIDMMLSGQNAQMVQHECSHLDGIPFSRMK
jgi:peptide deformylase